MSSFPAQGVQQPRHRADAPTLALADKLWLDMVNAERKREGHAAISYEVFEIVMDKIEKEWFDLVSWSDV